MRRGLIGKGSFKEVYEAINTETAILVAWNEMNAECSVTEVLILTRLSHPNIVHIHDVWDDPNHNVRVFISELLTSGSLRQFMRQANGSNLATPITTPVVKRWGVQILSGLGYLHEMNVWHRDLKCDNIFVNGNSGEVKIGDFGLSCVTAKSAAASVIGTPEFMAPEIYDENYTEKVDIYSFGMCLLEMTTGKYPYAECDNCGQVFKRVTQNIPPKALEEMEDKDTQRVINLCRSVAGSRPSAKDLIADPFFAQVGPAPVLPPSSPLVAAQTISLLSEQKEQSSVVKDILQRYQKTDGALMPMAPSGLVTQTMTHEEKVKDAEIASSTSSGKKEDSLHGEKSSSEELQDKVQQVMQNSQQMHQINQQPQPHHPTKTQEQREGAQERQGYTDQLTTLRANQAAILQKLHTTVCKN